MNKFVNKLKRFFINVKRSAIDLNYYKDILRAPFKFSLKYHFLLLFIISLIVGVKLAAGIAILTPQIPGFVNNAKLGAREVYPKELVATVKNGEVSTNVKEPYFIKLPKSWSEKDMNFIAIDTKAQPLDIQKYETPILLTKNSVVVIDNKSGYRLYPVSDFAKEDFALTNNEYQKFMDQVLPYLDQLPNLAIVLIIVSLTLWPILGTVVWLIWNLVWFLVIALIVLLITKLMKKKISFGKIYQMSLHAVTLPIIINLILGFFGASIPPLVTSGIMIIILSLAINRFEN